MKKVDNKELIGRLKSRLFFFVGGHAYFNNKIIKIRYDLLRKANPSVEYQQNEIFDFYENVIHLAPNERIMTKMPIS